MYMFVSCDMYALATKNQLCVIWYDMIWWVRVCLKS